MSQWAEIQAYSRKMSLTEFLSLAEQKKTELQTALEVHLYVMSKYPCALLCMKIQKEVWYESGFILEIGEFLPAGFTGRGQCSS